MAASSVDLGQVHSWRPTDRLGNLLLTLPLLYILVRPVSNNQILVPALAILGIAGAWSALSRRQMHHPWLVTAALLQLTYGATIGLVGSLQGNPGLTNGLLITLAAPLLYWAMVFGMTTRALGVVLATVAIGSCIVSLSIVLYVLQQRGSIPSVLPDSFLVEQGAGINERSDFVEIRFLALSTLVITSPMWIVSLALKPDSLMPSLRLRVFAASTAVLAAVVSGRNALVLVIVLAPFTLLALTWLLGGKDGLRDLRRERYVGRGLVLAVVLVGAAQLSFPGLFRLGVVNSSIAAARNLLLTGGESGYEQDIRGFQSNVLLRGFSEAPVFGHGAGAVIDGYSRNSLRPWNFELQYHLLLFQGGLVGALMFTAVLVVSFAIVRRAVRQAPQWSSSLIMTTVAAICLLMANASNPYLQAPGHLWGIYLPLAIAGISLRQSRHDGDRSHAQAVSTDQAQGLLLASPRTTRRTVDRADLPPHDSRTPDPGSTAEVH